MSFSARHSVTVAGTAPHVARRRLVIKVTAWALALFLGGYLLAVYVLFPPLAAPEDGIAVPNLIGQSLEGARDRLRPLALEVGDTISLPHGTVPPSIVIAQSPLAGQQLQRGAPVNLGLSSGLPAATVPYVVGMTARRASTLLTRLGFTVSQTVEASDRPKSTVLRSSPEAGIRQPLPARVVLVVSSGMPDLVLPDSLRVDTIIRDTLR
jgi:beta-lactam-binding protein with PASTA domain